MGTYTTNYNLFLPTIGEQGWGELVNGNFTTIDTTMKSLSNSIGTLETETDAVEERVTSLEAGNFETVNYDVSSNPTVTITCSGYSRSRPTVFIYSGIIPLNLTFQIKGSVNGTLVYTHADGTISSASFTTALTIYTASNVTSVVAYARANHTSGSSATTGDSSITYTPL